MKSFTALFIMVAVLSLSEWAHAAEPPAQQPSPATTSSSYDHAAQHALELLNLADIAAPEKADRKALDPQLMPSIKPALAPLENNPNLSKGVRDSAKKLARSKGFADIKNRLSPDLSAVGPSLEDLLPRLQQVLEPNLPAFSVVALTPGTTGLSGVTSCRQKDFYPKITDEVQSHSSAIRALADSVGRIEVKMGDSPPILLGTAFVIDRETGLIATACHVVDDLTALGIDIRAPSGKVLLDFGETDAHSPQNEFAVNAVAFMPKIEGCDGALLRVSPIANDNLRHLPAALKVAGSEPTMQPSKALTVLSIGYPGRDIQPPTSSSSGNVTQKTYDYFSCIRSASGGTAKFLFGGAVTADEAKTDYHILAHLVPTVGGQSGSPLIDATNPNDFVVVGIHICCVYSAHSETGSPCQKRNENYLQEAVSAVDLMKLFKQQVSSNAQLNHAQAELPSDAVGGQGFDRLSNIRHSLAH